jgi:aconitate hydratase
MGVLPLQFEPGQDAASLGLQGDETFNVRGVGTGLRPGGRVQVEAITATGGRRTFSADVRIDTPAEVEFFRNGGILHTVLRQILREPSR